MGWAPWGVWHVNKALINDDVVYCGMIFTASDAAVSVAIRENKNHNR